MASRTRDWSRWEAACDRWARPLTGLAPRSSAPCSFSWAAAAGAAFAALLCGQRENAAENHDEDPAQYDGLHDIGRAQNTEQRLTAGKSCPCFLAQQLAQSQKGACAREGES